MGVLFGSGIKLNIHMVPIDNHHLRDIDFQVEVYTNQGPNKVVVDKKEAFRIDNDNYTEGFWDCVTQTFIEPM